MEIQIYYQKWDEKSKDSHELLERVIRQGTSDKIAGNVTDLSGTK